MMSNQKQKLTTDEIEVRIWAFVVISVTLILTFIVISLLYSVTFVTQPIKSMAPIDQAYTKMLNDIVLLIVGGIGGVIGKRAMSSASRAFNPPTQPMCQPWAMEALRAVLTLPMPLAICVMVCPLNLSVLCLFGRTLS